MITGKNQIGNQKSAKGKTTFKSFNPVKMEENQWQFHEATKAEIEEAIALAEKAFVSFRNKTPLQRAGFLEAVASEIESLGEPLITTYMQESGLPEGRAKGECGRTVNQLRSFAALLREGSWVEAIIDTALPDRQPLPKPDIRKMSVPIGPVVVFGASNFPLAFSTAGGDTASALAAGCPVIVKGHPLHPGTGELVSNAIIRAADDTHMPNGVFSNLNGIGFEVGQKLVSHPGVKAVGFTGSLRGGISLFELAGKREEPIPVFAEMGSTNPVLLLPESLEDHHLEWAEKLAGSVNLGAGQFCTNPGLILGIKGKGLTAFTATLATKLREQDPQVMLHPAIKKGYLSGKEEMSKNKEVYILSEVETAADSNYAGQAVMKTDSGTYLKHRALQEEVFGPFSLIVECNSSEELNDVLRHLQGQLTGTVIGSEKEIICFSESIEVFKEKTGRLIFNGVPTGVEVCPAMHHGGPFPATTDARYTSVGTSAIKRWVRPVAYQDCPQQLLPDALKDENPLKIMRLVNGSYSSSKI